jgi:endonuclease/exonuclease/phosphatase family metal-dependent hydrolase
LTITAGWISADVHMGNEHFRFVTTHLETPIRDFPEATDVQVAQAQELIDVLSTATIPVVICGDFNSDANHGGFVDDTPTVGLLEAAGYDETWPATHGRGDLGLTWPLYLEDQFPGGGLPPPFFAESKPFERIDLFFSHDMDVVHSERVIAPARGSSMPPFGSDHAGVIAVFRP